MSAFEYYKVLHQMPELSEKEYETSKYIFNMLSEFGYNPVFLSETGVYADLTVDNNLPWLLFRADIDALPIKEGCDLPYASKHDGAMHACGHDAHTAMLLEAAKVLKSIKLTHNIRFVFQPAEETTTGAAKIINDIIPNNLIACFAMHVWPGVPFGQAITKHGALMASSDFLKLKFYGKSSHCSQQEKGNNALLSAVDMVSCFPTINKIATNDEAMLFCGSIHSGNLHNIVPDYSEIYGTIRTYSIKHREGIKNEINKTAHTIAQKYGTKPDVAYDGGCPPVLNDKKIVDLLVNDFGVLDNATATLAGEDFSLFGEFAPSCMMWLGIGDVPPLHNPKFYVPQDILPKGVELWLKLANYNWEDKLS